MNAIFNADLNWGIGRGNQLLFKLPQDMQRFKNYTVGMTVVMGENTLKSLPNGQPLSGRNNVVLTQDMSKQSEAFQITYAHSTEELFDILDVEECDDVFVIGGASVLNQLLQYCKYVYVTKILENGNADVFVTDLDKDKRFILSEQEEPFEDNGHMIQFCTYMNVSGEAKVW